MTKLRISTQKKEIELWGKIISNRTSNIWTKTPYGKQEEELEWVEMALNK